MASYANILLLFAALAPVVWSVFYDGHYYSPSDVANPISIDSGASFLGPLFHEAIGGIGGFGGFFQQPHLYGISPAKVAFSDYHHHPHQAHHYPQHHHSIHQHDDPNLQLAIQPRGHKLVYRDVPRVHHSESPLRSQAILVDARALPLTILFRSASSNLNVHQDHIASEGDYHESKSYEEPHR